VRRKVGDFRFSILDFGLEKKELNEDYWPRRVISRSDNLKSASQNENGSVLSLSLLDSPCAGQRPRRSNLRRFLGSAHCILALLKRPPSKSKLSSAGCASLVMSNGKTLSSSIAMRKGKRKNMPRWRPSSLL
jgi:hypothetical protein